MIYAISPFDEFRGIKRRPGNADQLECEGWLFLADRDWWDSTHIERLSEVTGLALLSPEYGRCASQAWWKAFAASFLRHQAAVPAIIQIGEPTDERWDVDQSPNGEVPSYPSNGAGGVGQLEPADRAGKIDRKWRDTGGLSWKIDALSDLLVPLAHVQFILGLQRTTRDGIRLRLHEITLLKNSPPKLLIRGPTFSWEISACGSWPSPISVNLAAFIERVREVPGPHIRLGYEGGVLSINDFRIEAREL